MKEVNLIIKLVYHDNGQLQIDSNEHEWENPFELLGILTYVKTSLEVKLVDITRLKQAKPIRKKTKICPQCKREFDHTEVPSGIFCCYACEYGIK